MRAFRLALILLVPISLVACGKKGALYLPDEAGRQQQSDSHLIGPITSPTAPTRSEAGPTSAPPQNSPMSTPPPAVPASQPGATPLSNPS